MAETLGYTRIPKKTLARAMVAAGGRMFSSSLGRRNGSGSGRRYLFTNVHRKSELVEAAIKNTAAYLQQQSES